MNKFRAVLFSIISGAITGAMVGLLFSGLFQTPFWPAVWMSAGVGLLIGFIACLGFMLFAQYVGRNPAAAFLSVGVIIGCGTALGGRLVGGMEPPILYLLVGVSELAGLTITMLWYLSYRRWNEKLHASHDKLYSIH
jgi:hypothetical protein